MSSTDLSYLEKAPGTYLPFSTDEANSSQHFIAALQRHASGLLDNSQWKPLNVTTGEITMAGASMSLSGLLQPIHPLVNEPLLSITGKSEFQSQMTVLAYLEEFRLEVHRLRQGLVHANDRKVGRPDTA